MVNCEQGQRCPLGHGRHRGFRGEASTLLLGSDL
ncbi:hypothetical protein DAI22_06g199200 [Oryza sativa Japonica Group]|nr:hypothetical protein DAI22_06g199200 [Oryza sativa Japonica Group]